MTTPNLSTLDILKLIIDKQLNMPPNRVWAYNNDVDLPKDDNLFIILFMTSQKPHANNVRYIQDKDGYKEVQTINLVEDIIISLVSKNTEARDRAYEIPLAINCNYSQEMQALHKRHFSIIGDIYDASFLEASSMLNRFDCKIRVFRSYEKINSINYYDKFDFELWTNDQSPNITKTQFSVNNEQ